MYNGHGNKYSFRGVYGPVFRIPALLTFLMTASTAQQYSSTVSWQEQMSAAREALAKKDTESARSLFERIRNDALLRRDDAAGLAAVRMLALMARASGDWAKTEDWLAEALDYTGRLKGYNSLEAVDVMVEIAGARRAREDFDGAAATLQQALNAAMAKGPEERSRSARIAATLGLVHLDRKEKQQARDTLGLAVSLWNETMRDDPELLPALESLGQLLRDESEYAQAAPLYERSLRIRENAYGPNSAELIVGLDNLSYLYFGLSRFEEAEPLYQRLLKVWTATGGPNHPMVALTLEKLAEFYSAQKKFEQADANAKRASEIRAGNLVGSLRLRARIAAQLDRPDEAIGFADKVLQVMDIAGVPKPEQKILPAPKNAKPVLPAKPRTTEPKTGKGIRSPGHQ